MKRYFIVLIVLIFISCKTQNVSKNNDSDNLQDCSKCDSNLFQCQKFVKNLISEMDSTIIHKGDTDIIIYDSLNYIRVKKEGDNSWINIFNEVKRYNFWIVRDRLEIWMGDSTEAKLMLYYDLK